ncbi:MAG: GTP cyclohydrolase II [Rubrivivax sp.]|nr:GTP cyclohydrolase II [Pyrinomonadaceae bacterium]
MLSEGRCRNLLSVAGHLRAQKTVLKVAETRLPTERGEFRLHGYRSLVSDEDFVCLSKGEVSAHVPTLARIHSQCLTGDVFGSTKCDCGPQLRRTLDLISAEGRGAVVYQFQEGRGIGIINKIRAYALQDEGADTVEANERLGLGVDLREYRQCVEVLHDLGLVKVRAVTNNPDKLRAMAEGGLEVTERVQLDIEPARDAVFYLNTKKRRMGHLIETAS